MPEIPGFGAAFAKAAPRMVLDQPRAKVLWDLAVARAGLAGAAAEVGVYKGGSLILLAQACPGRAVHGFDTFCGLPVPAPGAGDLHRGGDFGDAPYAAVAAACLPYPNIALYPGYFPATARPLATADFAVVHFDGDLYQSCKDTIDWFWPRIVPGGVLVFDDYGWPQCPGVARAVGAAGLPLQAGAQYQAYAVKPK